MIKKALVTAIAVALLGGFVFGRDLFSYAKTSANEVRKAVKREVPPEFELERAREMLDGLLPEIKEHLRVIAENQVEVERFEQEIARKEVSIRKQEQAILALREDLRTGSGTFTYASRTYSSDEVKRDLKERFDRFVNANEALVRDQKILTLRQKSLLSNEDKLDKMLLARKDLEVLVEETAARLNTMRAVEAAAATPSINIDNSELNRLKMLLAELNKDLDVREKMLDAEGKFHGLIPVETTDEVEVPENIENEIDTYFQEDPQEIGHELALEPTL